VPDAHPVYVADTHALVWYLTQDKKLGGKAQKAFDEVKANQGILVIPAVVLAELLMIIEKGRIVLPPSMFEASLEEWQRADNIFLSDLTPELVISAQNLVAIPDIFDRLIVAEALAIGAPIITKDPDIVNSNLAPVVW
jgi:PIN domain nuclease of toxin-antitoxin system